MGRRGFNPRARMGRDSECQPPANRNRVSTNAPASGATHLHRHRFHVTAVSTHAPAWGATYDRVHAWLDDMFQPTRPHGARPREEAEAALERVFQPTRPHGARPTSKHYTLLDIMFQPTRPHGARLSHFITMSTKNKVSTHAPAWGATQAVTVEQGHRGRFNPRARMGRDFQRTSNHFW